MALQVARVPSASQAIKVRFRSDVAPARKLARELGAGLGFSPDACEELALVASELATNLVKYARGGQLILTPIPGPARTGLQIESRDTGPGIPNINQALTDGYSTSGSFGTGLGAVNRLTDEFDIQSQLGTGTHVTCRKWVRTHSVTLTDCPLDFGFATRAITDVNGDDFVFKKWNGVALVGLIDGCGHGHKAHHAARTARQYAETHYDQPLEDIFAGVDRACRGTRGVVMALARFDWHAGTLTFGSIGNIEARLLKEAKALPIIVRRGILGAHAPRPIVATIPWNPESTLVLHTDGVSSRWEGHDFIALLGKPADEIARELLRRLTKTRDDASIAVVSPEKP